jgi:uncharacterized protein (TIGR04255 family)
MGDLATGGHDQDTPRVDSRSFARPPITELAISVQFRALAELRGINLGPLRTLWREPYPEVEEHPPLVPAIEAALTPQMNFQLNLGQGFTSRYWFVAQGGDELVQIQSDRFVVNWRKITSDAVYPRYKRLRAVFTHRLDEFADFLRQEGIGSLDITQAEVNYINRIVVDDESPQMDTFLRLWCSSAEHHLGTPSQASVAASFIIPSLGRAPSRLHVSAGPDDAVSPRSYFMTLIARGAPTSASAGDALAFIDGAHDHATRSFVELTTATMHERWGIDQ